MTKTKNILILFAILFAFSCKKSTNNSQNSDDLTSSVLQSIALNVCTASYEDLYSQSLSLQSAIADLQANPSQQNLIVCKEAWKKVRITWETSESWLFGPISTSNIDPRIDTWPVDFNEIDSVLNSGNVLSEAYVDQLEDALKGFHLIEYFLWGQNGNKLYSDITPREYEYLIALSLNLTKLSKEARDSWKNQFASEVSNAGNSSATYTTQQQAFVEIVDAMSGICDEVANGKMNEPFINQDASLEESPYAQNSLIDFTNNIKGVLTIYNGDYNGSYIGLEDLVRTYNTSLDLEIKNGVAEAIAALNTITLPYGQAIFSQATQIQNAIDKINALEQILDTKLKPFILQYTK